MSGGCARYVRSFYFYKKESRKSRAFHRKVYIGKVLSAFLRLFILKLLIKGFGPACKFNCICFSLFFFHQLLCKRYGLIKIGGIFRKVHCYCPGNIYPLQPCREICFGAVFLRGMFLTLFESLNKRGKLFGRQIPKSLIINPNRKRLDKPNIVNCIFNRGYSALGPLPVLCCICFVESA